ncbi:hypothetical protein EYZ11_005542 [Aspergillus tanneri]|uniref:Cyclic AMP-dependent transcription factor ATF-3 n=1 Tax=Aspergillus tanneri TaxID=1220188 RepID=A0A4S3JHR0_9EURO|nr:Cyclic AMP-dependent transcription factor ATF-3 [Aspergillus tanneri]KAA8649265.1 Cyclic AMP-dependent transcription factor ATF-3 [Aspergillus tanneri]THC94989.1 hypothetical protein EYZ11_005542 [Aspergillus tanneri]
MSAEIGLCPSAPDIFRYREDAPPDSLPYYGMTTLPPEHLSFPFLPDDAWLNFNQFPQPPTPAWTRPDLEQQQQQHQSPPKESTRKKTHNQSESMFTNEEREKEREKREQFLARNRMAASKCRQKKKQHTRQLQSRYEKVSFQKQMLLIEVEQLRSQMLQLKDELLRHSECDDVSIKNHLDKMLDQLKTREVASDSPDLRNMHTLPIDALSSTSTLVDDGSPPQFSGSDIMTAEQVRRDSNLSVISDTSISSLASHDGFDDLINYG